MEQLEFEAASPAEAAYGLSFGAVQRFKGREREPKELRLGVIFRRSTNQEFGRMGRKTQTLNVRPYPRKVRKNPRILQARLPRPRAEFASREDKEVEAPEALPALPGPRDSYFQAPPHIGQQGDDAVGLSHIHLTEHNPVQRPSHATEMTK